MQVWGITAEFLHVLVENIGRVVTHEHLHERVRGRWAETIESNEKRWSSVRKFHVQKALDELGAPAKIEAVWGRGYRLVLGETDPEAEFVARCFRHRRQIEELLASLSKPRRAA